MILTLPFLGKRKYLQGTTLLDALLPQINALDTFSFKIKKPIFSNKIEVTQENGGQEHSAELQCSGQSLFVKPLPPLLPIEREPFDEPALVRHVQKQGERFILPSNVSSPVRAMVSVFKHALLTSYSVPQRPGQWAFARLDATRLTPDTQPGFALEKIFCRDGTACCSVVFESIPSATLYFAWTSLEKEAS